MYKTKNRIIVIAILLLTAYACNTRNSEDTLLAEACGKKLYLSDLKEVFSTDEIGIDSIGAISTYTSAWVRRQLTTKKAEELLDEKQKDVQAEVEDYRSSLLIYRFEHDYVLKHIDTVITPDEIRNIYNENNKLFKTSSTLVQVTYIKIQTDTPETENIKKMCRFTANIKKIEELCMMYADKYDTFNDKWFEIHELMRLLPANRNQDEFERILAANRFYETQDAKYSYFVRLKSILPKGSVAPLEKERENIRTIILSKRKYELINKLEQEIYNAGISNNDAKIYINNNN
ncbi:MAG: hypothetical protein LBP63_02475 [Prevotellaceae bacterium]|jgi:hypothetical protein|nr:hypothetical protein [Prevotellaceae bacterium]